MVELLHEYWAGVVILIGVIGLLVCMIWSMLPDDNDAAKEQERYRMELREYNNKVAEGDYNAIPPVPPCDYIYRGG